MKDVIINTEQVICGDAQYVSGGILAGIECEVTRCLSLLLSRSIYPILQRVSHSTNAKILPNHPNKQQEVTAPFS